jgi:hypothetical protein
VDPGHALIGVGGDHSGDGLGAGVVDRDVEPIGERAFHEIAGHGFGPSGSAPADPALAEQYERSRRAHIGTSSALHAPGRNADMGRSAMLAPDMDAAPAPCQCGEVSAELELLERSYHLSMLRDALGSARAERRGVLVLLGGEAGGGKTALLSRFADTGEPADRVLWGSCDPLFTPRPLGPFLDIAQDVGGELADLAAAGAKPYHIAAALVRVAQSARSTIVVCEDLHWADEATLDVLSLLGRRIADIPALVIATYRDDELDRTHPLRGCSVNSAARPQSSGSPRIRCRATRSPRSPLPAASTRTRCTGSRPETRSSSPK